MNVTDLLNVPQEALEGHLLASFDGLSAKEKAERYVDLVQKTVSHESTEHSEFLIHLLGMLKD